MLGRTYRMKQRLRNCAYLSFFAVLLFMAKPAYSALEGSSVILTDPSIGATTSITISFTLPTGVMWAASTGTIAVTFPDGFDVSSVGPADTVGVLGLDGGGFTTDAPAGQVVTATRNAVGGNIAEGTDIKIEIKNIVNPSTAGLTGTFLITITNDDDNATADGVVIAESLNLGGGRNSSKFCLVESSKENFLMIYLTLGFLITTMGVNLRKEKISA